MRWSWGAARGSRSPTAFARSPVGGTSSSRAPVLRTRTARSGPARSTTRSRSSTPRNRCSSSAGARFAEALPLADEPPPHRDRPRRRRGHVLPGVGARCVRRGLAGRARLRRWNELRVRQLPTAALSLEDGLPEDLGVAVDRHRSSPATSRHVVERRQQDPAVQGVQVHVRSSSKSTAACASAPFLGRLGRRGTRRGSPAESRARAGPTRRCPPRRRPSSALRAGSCARRPSVSTSPSVARIAASERVRGERAADAADVDVLEPRSSREPRRNVLGEAVGRGRSPPAIGLPIVTSGSTRAPRCTRPARSRSCASRRSRAASRDPRRPRAASWKPGSGWTIPTFVSAGSVSTTATSRRASSRSRPSTSLN